MDSMAGNKWTPHLIFFVSNFFNVDSIDKLELLDML
jgi:hypothetical protein